MYTIMDANLGVTVNLKTAMSVKKSEAITSTEDVGQEN